MPDKSPFAPRDPFPTPTTEPATETVEPPPSRGTEQPIAPEASAGDTAGHAEIDELLKQASFEDPCTEPVAPQVAAIPDVNSFDLPNFQQVMQAAPVSS